MRALFAVALLSAGLLGVATGASAGDAFKDVPLAGNTADAQAVAAEFETWVDDYARGDLAGVMNIFDHDLVFEFQGAPDAHYADMQASYAQDFKSRRAGTVWVPAVQEIYADGNLAFVRSYWELRVSDAAGKAEVKARNRSMDVFRRGASGRWLIFRSLNYPEKN